MKIYKILINMDDNNLQPIFEGLGEKGELLLEHNIIFFKTEMNKSEILSFFKKINVEEFICNELDYEKLITQSSFVRNWCEDILEDYAVVVFERDNQEFLQQMADRYEKAIAVLDNMKTNYNKNKKGGEDSAR